MSQLEADLQELRTWTKGRGIDIDGSLVGLSNYIELLKIWSGRMSLIGSAEMPLLVRKHLADCIYAGSHCPPTGRAADLGAGAGLPGIPVAIMHPALEVDLVESRAKKISFLAAASVGLRNARPLNQRIEALAGENYDLALARALAPLASLLPLARPVLRPGGSLLAMKSAAYEHEIATVSPESVGFSLRKVDSYRLPSGEERALLVFDAVA